MARPKKPVDAQTGHATGEYRERRAMAEGLVAQEANGLLREKPPELLNKDAAGAWDVLTGYLLKVSFYGDINVPDVVGYCNAWAMYVAAWRRIKRARNYEEKRELARDVKQWSEEMTRCQNRGGFSVSSRITIGESGVDAAQEEISGKFGI